MDGFVTLKSQDTDSKREIKLFDIRTILGRGSLLGIGDKKVSRNHALLVWKDNTLTLESTHMNPCFVTFAESGKKLSLRNGGSAQLSDGDCFSFLQDKYIFKVCIADNTCSEQLSVKKSDNSKEQQSKDLTLENRSEFEHNQVNVLPNNCSSKNEGNNISISKPQPCQTLSNKMAPSVSQPVPVTPQKLCKVFLKPKGFAVPCSKTPEKRKRQLPPWMTKYLQTKLDTGSSKTNAKLDSDSDEDRDNMISANITANNAPAHHEVDRTSVEKSEVSLGGSIGASPQASHPPEVLDDNCEFTEKLSSSQTFHSQIGTKHLLPTVAEECLSTTHCKEPVPKVLDVNTCSDAVQDHPELPASVADDAELSRGIDRDSENSSPHRSSVRDPCVYGPSCYRRNPLHFQEFSHPGDADYTSPPDSSDEDDDNRPECEYGLHCYRKNPLHRYCIRVFCFSVAILVCVQGGSW